MKYRYTKYVSTLMDEIDLEDLVSKLSDMLLSSGFTNPWGDPTEGDEDRTMQALHDAILEALFSGGVLSEEALQKILGEPADGDQEAARQELEELVEEIINRMMEQGFITGAPDLEEEREHRRGSGGGMNEPTGPVKFEVTDKALDFLGYRALRDLLGSVGRSAQGRHDTRHLATGIEAISAPKPYEFGDTVNLDPSSTILNAVQRLHASGEPVIVGPDGAGGISVDYSDLMVAQSEYQSSCATVIMLDCSHSMILYGEDRPGTVPSDPHAIPRRLAARGAFPRFGGGDSVEAARARPRRAVLHEHTRGTSPCAPHPRTTEEGHATDRDGDRR